MPTGNLPFINNVTVKPVLGTHFMARLKDQGLYRACTAFAGKGDMSVGGSLSAAPFDSSSAGADWSSPLTFKSMGKVRDFMARSNEALILTDGQGKITAINKPWFDMCGYTSDEVYGKTCAILQGRETDMEAVTVFNQQIQNREEAEMTVVNYKKGEELLSLHSGLTFVRVLYGRLFTLAHRHASHSRPQATCRF